MIHFIYRSKGKDKRGVRKLWANGIRFSACIFGVSLGLFLRFVSYRIGGRNAHSRFMFLSNGVLGGLFLYGFVHTVAMRRQIKKLRGANQFAIWCRRVQVEDTRREQGIKPRYNINGEDFYDIKDFGDAAVLLRASIAPAAEPETLLRPAAGTATPAENLLRPSAAPQTAQTKTQTSANGRSDAP